MSWFSIFTYLMMFLHTFIGLILIAVILLQRGHGGGLAGAFGGMGGQSALGTKAGDVFTKITIVLATIWIVLGCVCVLMASNSRSKAQRMKFDPNVSTAPAEDGESAKTDDKGGDNKPDDKNSAPPLKSDAEKADTEQNSKSEKKPEPPAGEGQPAEKPAEKPAETKPAETKPAETKPAQDKPAEAKEKEPSKAEPAKADETKPEAPKADEPKKEDKPDAATEKKSD